MSSAKPAATATPVIPIVMPQVGNSMEEGTIARWHVAAGDRIQVGQLVCEIETDKATIEVDAEHGGRVARLLVEEGDVIPIREPIALLADDDAAVEPYLATLAPGTAAGEPKQTASAPTAATRIAQTRGITLAGSGSGPGGRLLSTDLGAAPAGASRTPLSRMRRAIANHLVRSKQTVPHFYVRRTLVVDALLAFARAQKLRSGASLNDVVVWACGHALARHPALRTHLEGGELVEYPRADLGIAVAVEAGLVVPVVTDVANRSLASLAAETRSVIELARAGQLDGAGYPVLTVTNLGKFGVDEFAAIINPPEPAILAVGAVSERVITRGGHAVTARTMTVTLSADHRVVDGVEAARFLATLAELLEGPSGGDVRRVRAGLGAPR